MQKDLLDLTEQFLSDTLSSSTPLFQELLTSSFESIPKVDVFGTLLACGVLMMCTVLGLTPLALVLLYSANLLFRLPRSPLGREPLYLLRGGGTGNPRLIFGWLENMTQLFF